MFNENRGEDEWESEAIEWTMRGFAPASHSWIKDWKKQGFDSLTAEPWIKSGLLASESEFANYLKQKGHDHNTPNLKKIIVKESWRDIHYGFSYLVRKDWEQKKFTHDQTREWIDAGFQPNDHNHVQEWKKLNFTAEKTEPWIIAGAKINDHGFVVWLRDIKKYTPAWITNYKEDYQILSKRFKKYGLCKECNQPNTGEQWCLFCNEPRIKKNFAKWTSHNSQINGFIQKYQLQATDADKFLEWIPYEQFKNIEYLTEGGFGKVYKAQWTAGNIHHWDQKSKQWQREKDDSANYKEVVLKILTNSQNNTDFLQETANHKIIDDWFNNIVPCYGISQDPEGNYLMVMQYLPEGNLRHYLRKNNKTLSLSDKFSQLVNISRGLKDIHQKNLVHHDFHSGNILKGIGKTACLITDLGLCKPANETSEEKVYGVLPYVAPEVLQSQPYTQASDVYSFGIISHEVLSGFPPYYDRNHDVKLAVEVCHGIRPQFKIKIPPLLKDLINRCWDANPQNRPTVNELERTLRSWEQGNPEFKSQLQGAEEFNQNLPNDLRFPNYQTYKGAIYTSKLLPTKEITQLMQSFNFQTKALELNEQLTKIKELSKEITVEQKYNDFKKVLKLVLEKSDELETMITTNQLVISDEMKGVLIKIKELKSKSPLRGPSGAGKR